MHESSTAFAPAFLRILPPERRTHGPSSTTSPALGLSPIPRHMYVAPPTIAYAGDSTGEPYFSVDASTTTFAPAFFWRLFPERWMHGPSNTTTSLAPGLSPAPRHMHEASPTIAFYVCGCLDFVFQQDAYRHQRAPARLAEFPCPQALADAAGDARLHAPLPHDRLRRPGMWRGSRRGEALHPHLLIRNPR